MLAGYPASDGRRVFADLPAETRLCVNRLETTSWDLRLGGQTSGQHLELVEVRASSKCELAEFVSSDRQTTTIVFSNLPDNKSEAFQTGELDKQTAPIFPPVNWSV